MKKILVMALLATGMVASAQERPERPQRPERAENLKHQLTPEEKADLHIKRMTLDLDLTEKQQKEVRSLVVSQEKERDAKMEQFKRKVHRNQISCGKRIFFCQRGSSSATAVNSKAF